MRTSGLAVIVVAVLSIHASPVLAQATRTWVSGVGDDANPCSRTAPCKTFAGTISKTAAKGEINVLDPGGYGAVTITKSISIISTLEAGVLASSGNGIIVNVSSTDKVLLEGLDIEGFGTGTNGVHIIGSGQVTIRRCSIRNFAGNGINLVGTDGARAYVQDSLILNNGGGFKIEAQASASNKGFAQNTIFDTNTNFGVQVNGASALVLIGSTLVGSPFSISTSSGGQVISYGNNVLRNGGIPTQTLVLQ